KIEIVFLKRIRDEITFCSKDALINQIESDVIAAKDYFSLTKV
ncbi:MAG: riboflavin kinase, partial [Actinobacteria bacterium]|nr:riboflavin kinase [Actinomycetota bacterium]